MGARGEGTSRLGHYSMYHSGTPPEHQVRKAGGAHIETCMLMVYDMRRGMSPLKKVNVHMPAPSGIIENVR